MHVDPTLRQPPTSTQAVSEAARHIAALDQELNAFTHLRIEAAFEEAAQIDADADARGRDYPLRGLTVGVKDNIDVAGTATTHGAARPFHRHAHLDAPAVARLRSAGAVVVGKTNLHEFAWGGTSESEFFGATRNPWDTRRNAHGSSGGSAVAVAAGMVPVSLGTDTGGSIRNPAAVTGITGHRPSLGAIPLVGVGPVAPTMDTVGPMARDVATVRRIFQVMCERPAAASGAAAARKDRETPFRILVDADLTASGIEPGVRTAYLHALSTLADLGVEVIDTDLSNLNGHCEAWLLTQVMESGYLHRDALAAFPDDYSQEVRVQMLAGMALDGRDYFHVQQFREQLRGHVREHLRSTGADAIVTPTSARIAQPLGADPLSIAYGRFETGRTWANYTSLPSALAYPALSLPCGFSDGLPVGMQLIGPPGSDLELFDLGERIQEATAWHLAVPAVAPGS